MTATDQAVPVTATAGRTARAWWVWAVPFAAIFCVLVARNWFLFSTRLYEQGDSGKDSILVEQAMRFRLLVGAYSREHFHHPGPAQMYVKAAGEWLARDVLHVVPTPWNGQLLAVFALSSALAAIAVGIVYNWTHSVASSAAAFAVILGFALAHPEIVNSGWLPDMYVMSFFVFALSAASVAARRAGDLWALALSGWLLIHGHACFLFFVPFITGAAAIAALWPSRRSLGISVRAFVRDQRRAWVPALVISALFMMPIAIDLILHWPGDFGKYFAYGNSASAGGHTPGQVVRYTLWFWWPHEYAWAVVIVLVAGALAVTRWLLRGPLRRFAVAVLGMTALTTLAFLYYASAGIDSITTGYYIGYFYWSAPFLLLTVIAVGLIQAVRPPVAVALLCLCSAAALIGMAVLPGIKTSLRDSDPGLPRAVSALAARGPGRPIVVTVEPGNAWVDVTGFIVQSERTGVRACVRQYTWGFTVTKQFVCTHAEDRAGVTYDFFDPGPAPAGRPVILRFGTAIVTAGLPAVSAVSWGSTGGCTSCPPRGTGNSSRSTR